MAPSGGGRNRRVLPRDARAETGSAHRLGDPQGLFHGHLALQAQGQVAPLPDEGGAGQAGLLLPKLAGAVLVAEEVGLAAEEVAGLAADRDVLDHAGTDDL